eukprot:g7578.t1
MPNWLASELCMVASFSLGAWKTFKVLKHGGTDYNLLKTWCLLGLLRAFEEYFEFLVSWIPFYWLGKCLGLGLLYLPGGNIPTVVFERFVVLGMDKAHHVLNNLVVPNVVEFAVSLPWRVLLVLFPSMPPPPSSGGGGGSAWNAGKKNAGGRGAKGKGKGKGALGSQLQHLNTPTKRCTKTTSGAGGGGFSTGRGGGGPEAQAAGERGSRQPPPLPARSPPQSPTSTSATAATVGRGRASGGRVGDWAGAARESNASALVDQLLRADNNSSGHADAAARRAGATSTPVRGERVVGGDGGEGSSPESGLSGGSSSGGGSRPARRRRSFGEILRSAVTGNSKVRVRDHLFDLTTASPAPPLPDGSLSRGAAPEPPSRSPSMSPPSSARPDPVVSDGSGTRGSKRRQETAAPRKASASSLPAISGGYGDNELRKGRKKEDDEEEEEQNFPGLSSLSSPPPPRSSGLTRRRVSEFGSGGGGDEAGGGGSFDASSRTGRGRREAGGGAAAAPGRQSLEKTSSSSSVSSNGRGSTGRSAAASRTSAARGASTTSARTTGSRSAAAGDAGDASTAAAIADPRAKRLAEWRKKRANNKSRHEQAEKLRGTRDGNGNGNGGNSGGVDETMAVAAGDGWRGTNRGSEDGSVRGGGVVTRSSAPARTGTGASLPAKSRRFRHVERFRSEMARTVPGAAPRAPQEDVAGGAVPVPAGAAGSLRQKRGVVSVGSSSRSNRD